MYEELICSLTTGLQVLGSQRGREGMARFGINTQNALGVSMPAIQEVAKAHKKNHPLALELWKTGIHEMRILAVLVDDRAQVTPAQMDEWVQDFNSWDVCDQVCLKLFCHTPHAIGKIPVWAAREEEFVRRAAFALIAAQAVHLKKEPDEYFHSFFSLIRQYADDERNFVKKAVSWALRQTGKRNAMLRFLALELAEELQSSPSRSARWIGHDAYKELSKPVKSIRPIV